MQSKSEAKAKYKLNELHWRYPHVLWAGSYSCGIEYAYANLPVFQGALMLMDADAAKLSQVVKENLPTAKQMRDLKSRLDRASRYFQSAAAIASEREVIQKLNTVFEKFGKEKLVIPADSITIYHLQDVVRDCMILLGPANRTQDDLVAWKRMAAWWIHFLPPSLAEHFILCEERAENTDEVKHQLKVRAEPVPDVPTDDDGVYWAGFTTMLEWPKSRPGISISGTNQYMIDIQKARKDVDLETRESLDGICSSIPMTPWTW